MSRPVKVLFRFAFIFSCFILAMSCATYAQEGEKTAGKAPLTVYTLDIGQGDSSIITTPSGKNILIDGGMGGSGYKKKDKGKTVIIPFLKEKGIKKLDYIIMTHPDFDHIGGLVYLLNHTTKESEYPVEIVDFLDPGHPGTTYLYKDELLKAVKDRPEIKFHIVKNGEMLDFGEGVTAQVFGPSRIFSPDDPNNSSIIIKLIYGDVSFLLTGDAAKESEMAMIEDYGDKLKSTVLHAGHHGSDHSSKTAFLNKVKPEVIKISVGKKNKFILPDENALKRLEDTGAKIYRTDYQGMITITTDGKTYEVVTERPVPPEKERWDYVPVLTEKEKMNINTASAAELQTLPKIGKKIAQRIIDHRPFKSIDDLKRVPRIGDKIVDRIRPLVTVGTAEDMAAAGKKAAPSEEKPVKAGKYWTKTLPPGPKININTASAAELESLPNIGAKKAQLIIEARPFNTVDDIVKVKGIGPKTLELLRPRLTVRGK